MPPDSLDRRLVAALERDGREVRLSERLAADDPEREAVRAVAEATDTPATTVQRRLQELEEQGVIGGYEPRIDYDALGYSVAVVLRIEADEDALEAVCDRLGDLPGVTDVYRVTGAANVIAVGRFADADALDARLYDLLTDTDVRTVHADVVRETVCEHDPPGLEDS